MENYVDLGIVFAPNLLIAYSDEDELDVNVEKINQFFLDCVTDGILNDNYYNHFEERLSQYDLYEDWELMVEYEIFYDLMQHRYDAFIESPNLLVYFQGLTFEIYNRVLSRLSNSTETESIVS